MSTQTHAIMVQPGTMKELHAFGDRLTALLGGQQNGGALTVIFDMIPPDGDRPLHVYSRED